MLHKPAATGGKDPAASYKMRLGVWMFGLYLLFYAGFVVINLTSPQLMEKTILLGLNMATVYGFALIIVALLQALLYDWFCRREEKRLAGETSETKESK
ncbi:MAG TPA: DUF485 domain-containing protein [Anaerolineaceae bacterium]